MLRSATITIALLVLAKKQLLDQRHAKKTIKSQNDDNSDDNDDDAKNSISILLSNTEQKLHKFNFPPISTFTWFKGDYEKTETLLRERLKLIVAKNPWLQGRIHVRGKKAFLQYAKIDNDDALGSNIDVDQHFHVVSPSESPISRNTEIAEIGTRLCDDQGLKIKQSSTDTLFKVFIVPCQENPKSKFGLLMQMSHAIADGATYYQVINMLCRSSDKEDIISLNPERKTFSMELKAAMGNAEVEYPYSIPSLVRFVRGLIQSTLSKKSRINGKYAFFDSSKLQQVKIDYAKKGDVPYVSTNDVITSWFMNQVGTETALMVVNMRKRLSCLAENDAGNYASFLFYRKEDYATPALIRKSIPQLQRVVTVNQKLPTFLDGAFKSEAFVTNWMTFSKPFEIEGCEEELHIPVGGFKMHPCTRPLLVIFRAGKGKIGLKYYVKEDIHLDLDTLVNSATE